MRMKELLAGAALALVLSTGAHAKTNADPYQTASIPRQSGYETRPKVADAEGYESRPKVADAEGYESRPKVADAEGYESRPKVADAEGYESRPKVA
jgi:hypothetical protein